MDLKTVKHNCLNSEEVVKWAYFPKKVEYPFNKSRAVTKYYFGNE